MNHLPPRRGDIITVDLNPVRGHEQSGLRPALIISGDNFNARTGLVIICPIASRIKDGPFEIPLQAGKTIGRVLANQIRTIDFRERRAVVCDRADEFTVSETLRKLKLIID